MSKMRPVYFTSDHHFYHENIIKYCNRPFRSVGEMHDQMIAKWNKAVPNDARVYYLGDFGWGDRDSIEAVLVELNYDQLVWVPGNHDRSVTWIDKLASMATQVVAMNGPMRVNHGGREYIISHEPVPKDDMQMGDVNLHGHIHCHRLVRRDAGCLWFNVGVDMNKFRPWRLSEIEARMKKVLPHDVAA